MNAKEIRLARPSGNSVEDCARFLLEICAQLAEINEKTLTLRDQFALAAMQAECGRYRCGSDDGTAKWAYQMADAMLEARKTKEESDVAH